MLLVLSFLYILIGYLWQYRDDMGISWMKATDADGATFTWWREVEDMDGTKAATRGETCTLDVSSDSKIVPNTVQLDEFIVIDRAVHLLIEPEQCFHLIP